MPIEVVVGSAPGWTDPWSRVQPARVVREGYDYVVVGIDGIISREDVQLARLTKVERH